ALRGPRRSIPPLGGPWRATDLTLQVPRQSRFHREERVPTMTHAPTVRLTVAQAVVTYLSRQYSVADGESRPPLSAPLGIFGHGNVAGLGQALDQLNETMPFI